MPKNHFDSALVKNLTPHIKTLRSGTDSVSIMPNSEARIDHKFLTWQPPKASHIRVLRLMAKPISKIIVVSENNKGKKITDSIVEELVKNAAPVEVEAASKIAEENN